MRVLIACEYSGRVRDAFVRSGHYAMSVDLLPSEAPGEHYMGDVRDVLYSTPWDLMVCHPPCQYLAVSGMHWTRRGYRPQSATDDALEFVRMLMNAPIPHIALENPVSIISTQIRKPDQIIQPWMFGHGETKRTCLWLKGLPKLVPTNVVAGQEPRILKMSEHPDRWKERSRTYSGIADAMGSQWGKLKGV